MDSKINVAREIVLAAEAQPELLAHIVFLILNADKSEGLKETRPIIQEILKYVDEWQSASMIVYDNELNAIRDAITQGGWRTMGPRTVRPIHKGETS